MSYYRSESDWESDFIAWGPALAGSLNSSSLQTLINDLIRADTNHQDVMPILEAYIKQHKPSETTHHYDKNNLRKRMKENPNEVIDLCPLSPRVQEMLDQFEANYKEQNGDGDMI